MKELIDPLRVKLIGNWGSSSQICDEWNRMSQGDLRWNDIQICSDDDADFFVIVNYPFGDEHYVPERTIVFQMEPWCGEDHQTWGVKTWGVWSKPDDARFLQVRSHDRFLNNVFWRMKSTYSELRLNSVEKTGLLSTMCSEKYFDPGHIKRVDFLRYCDAQNDDVVNVEMFAYDNKLGLDCWVGPHPPGENDATLLPYRYFIGVENNVEHNFITEKLWEPLLAEALCFYWGAPNASEHVDSQAFIPIDLDDFESAFATIKDAIETDQWSKRVEIIRNEKRRLLEELQFFPTIERILREEFRFTSSPTDEEVIYHKYFSSDLGADLERVVFLHSYTKNGDIRILAELLDAIDAAPIRSSIDRIYIVIVGESIDLEDLGRTETDGYRLINYSADAHYFEMATLRVLKVFSSVHDYAKVLYMHTKGASYDEIFPVIEDWRHLMVHFLVERGEEIPELLDDFDVVGCNSMAEPNLHFSGNFWWANASYLATLKSPDLSNRHEAERWVCSGEGVRTWTLHDSGVNHYQQRYLRENYVNE